jgi:hypothetical protein
MFLHMKDSFWRFLHKFEEHFVRDNRDTIDEENFVSVYLSCFKSTACSKGHNIQCLVPNMLDVIMPSLVYTKKNMKLRRTILAHGCPVVILYQRAAKDIICAFMMCHCLICTKDHTGSKSVMYSRVQRFWPFWKNGASQTGELIKYVFRFFEPFRPILALKFEKSADISKKVFLKSGSDTHKTKYSMLGSNLLKKLQKSSPIKSYRPTDSKSASNFAFSDTHIAF